MVMSSRPSTTATARSGMAATNATMLLSAILSVVLLSTPCAFAQRAEQEAGRVAKFQTALEQDGFSVSVGMISTVDWAGMYCKGERADAGYVNRAPYLMIQVPESVAR